MRFFSTRVHGVLDYLLGVLLIALPWLLVTSPASAAGGVPIALGALILISSLLTDYELGAARRIQMPVHLWLDALAGLVLAASPWVFAFDKQLWIPHVALGAALVVVAFLTNTIPSYERRRAAELPAG
jgi:hypothetical protein